MEVSFYWGNQLGLFLPEEKHYSNQFLLTISLRASLKQMTGNQIFKKNTTDVVLRETNQS